MIDREVQKTETFSGIPNQFGRAQDAAMTDSMGTIVDRREEHLGTTDAAIIRMRRTSRSWAIIFGPCAFRF